MPTISKAALRRLISHHGMICLLDTIERWVTPVVCVRLQRIRTRRILSGETTNRRRSADRSMRHKRWRRTAERYGTSNLLAREVASRDVIVNVVALGIIESRMVEHSCKPENIEALVPIKQAGTPQEVTYLVGFRPPRRPQLYFRSIDRSQGVMA